MVVLVKWWSSSGEVVVEWLFGDGFLAHARGGVSPDS